MSTSVEFDLFGLITAIESRERELLLDLYAPDAELCIFDSDTTAAPQLLVGRAAIGRWLDSLRAQSYRHRVVDFVVDGDRVSWTDHCRNAEGLNLIHQSTAELEDGRLRQHTVTVVWEDCYY